MGPIMIKKYGLRDDSLEPMLGARSSWVCTPALTNMDLSYHVQAQHAEVDVGYAHQHLHRLRLSCMSPMCLDSGNASRTIL